MAKNSIRDFDATSGNNTDIQSIDVSEGCPASGINNALRELMTDLKNVSTGAVALETPAADQLNVDNLRLDGNTISSTDTNGDITLDPNGTGDTIVASGNVGIGGAPNDTLHVYGDIVIENTSNTPYIDFVESGDNTDSKARILMNQESGTSADLEFHTESGGTLTKRVVFDHDGHVQIQCNASTGDLLWKEGTTDVWAIKTNGANSHLAFYDDYNNAERMRIANSGEVIIGAITQGASSCLRLDGNGTVMVVRVQNASDGTLRNGILFRNASDSTVGVIQVNSSSTNYATSSDYRLKENVADMTGAITRVKALSPKRFNFIVDPDRTVDGFLAHEAQTVVPEAITGTHNEVDDDGNAVMQGIDQSKLVPLLTGALQEAIAKIETLETQRADLEARLTALENA